jgi:D-cysteine desulfhydrase
MASNREIFCHFPRLKAHLSVFHLAQLPTPVEPLILSEIDDGAPRSGVFVKRDDLTSEIYGGNKIRTLEFIFGGALSRGVQRIVATGAYGSNHAVATVLHAHRAGLSPGAILFPQPGSACALENLEVVVGHIDPVHWIPHWAFLPWSMWRVQRYYRQLGEVTKVMVPGGATPAGAFGYVSAALELAGQVEEGLLPCPKSIVLPIGSTCTIAGLAVGVHLASKLGFGFVNRQGGEPSTAYSRHERDPLACDQLSTYPVSGHENSPGHLGADRRRVLRHDPWRLSKDYHSRSAIYRQGIWSCESRGRPGC